MRLDWREFLTTGGYLLLVPMAFQVESAALRTALVAALFLLALSAGLLNLRRLRAIRDTPTSRVASAAQGYVELVGTGRIVPDQPLFSPTHGLPCLWYRYRAYKRQGDKWHQTESKTSDALFILDDGSDRCLIDPIGADVVSRRVETYIVGDNKVEEELLLAEDTLYALGDFTTLSAAPFDERTELGRILEEWKEDQAELHRRFDLNDDGRIDQQEWQLARQAARREMETRRTEAVSQPVTHLLRKPRYGRPYLIANFSPEPLTRRYRLRVLAHVAMTVAGLIWLAIAVQGL